MSNEAIFNSALALPEPLRADLAVRLLHSLDELPHRQRKSPEEWDAAIDRRVESALKDETPGVGHDDAVAAIRRAGKGE